MEYACLKNNVINFGSYALIPIREQDVLMIKEWRNGQMKILRKKDLLSDEDQKRYFSEVICPLFGQSNPDQILFSFLHDHQLIGYGGLVHINWIDQRGEISFLAETARFEDKTLYRKDFSAFLKMIKKLAFEELGFNKIFTETFDIREHHVNILEEEGFVMEGRLKKHNLIEDQWIDSLMHGFLKIDY